jgi:hypothetical protein
MLAAERVSEPVPLFWFEAPGVEDDLFASFFC